MDNVYVEMFEWSCAACGCVMTMTKDFNEQLRVNHKVFYCLNGHGNIYRTKSTIEELEGKLANEYAKNAQLEVEIEKLKKSFLNRLFDKKK